MKTALIRYKDMDAGLLEETDEGYEFRYLDAYMKSSLPKALHRWPLGGIYL